MFVVRLKCSPRQLSFGRPRTPGDRAGFFSLAQMLIRAHTAFYGNVVRDRVIVAISIAYDYGIVPMPAFR
jgi:hypothetical protein